MPQKSVSHYEIERKIGEGGMGEVYLARDVRLDRRVALKFLPEHLSHDPKSRERLLREAKAASKLSHPNILTIHEVGEDADGNVFIAMAYVEGDTLDYLIARGAMPSTDVSRIAIQIAEGLARAHAAGVVHRDIKPQNIVVDSHGRVTILDFGLAKLVDAAKLTQTGAMIGTMSYMSPEQARGGEVDHRTDFFSFGAVLYEMVTGCAPFSGDNPAAVLLGIINDTPLPPSRVNSECPPGLDLVIQTAMAKNPDDRFQSAEDMLTALNADLGTEALPHRSSKSARVPGPVLRHRLARFLIPTTLVSCLALGLMIFNPFRFSFIADQEAHADRSTLAVMYFDSVTDPNDADKNAQMITNLLITDLSESDYMSVVSQQRLFDILKNLGQANLARIDRTVASDVAHEAGASWILTGSILQVHPTFVLTSTISDAENGRILASQRVEGDSGDDIFAVVDRLGTEIRKDLALPEEAAQESNRPLSDLTTNSQEAYKSYLAGLDDMQRLDFVGAEESFSRATALDSNFAMAYYRLARAHRSRLKFNDANRSAEQAARLADHATPLERLYIENERATAQGDFERSMKVLQTIVERYPDEKEALMLLADYHLVRHQGERAAQYYEQAVALDPSYKLAINNMAYAYKYAGNYDKAIETINRYIALAPDEPNPYDTRGDMYADYGRPDEAMASYRSALERKPDFSPSIAKLGNLHLIRREYAIADSVYHRYFSSPVPEDHSMGRYCLALIPAAQGKLTEAVKILEDGVAADKLERVDPFHTAELRFVSAELLSILGRPVDALRQCADGVAMVARSGAKGRFYARALYVGYLAEAGRFAEAQDSLSALETDVRAADTTRLDFCRFAAARMGNLEGDYTSAVTLLTGVNLAPNPFAARYELANACLGAGRLGQATELFKEILASYDEYRGYCIAKSVRVHYLLGRAFEQSGWKSEALDQYREFLSYWESGDRELKEVDDARARIVRIQTQV